MGTWVKATDQAIYLMAGNGFLDAVAKRPSRTNPKEQVADITPLKAWFARSDRPRRMTVSVDIDAPEPDPVKPDGNGDGLKHNGQFKVVNDTHFKLSPKNSSELMDREKVFVTAGRVFNIKSYEDVGSFHWRVELATPLPGTSPITSWYVFVPHIRLMTDAVLTVTNNTFFKLEPKLSSQLPNSAKVFVRPNTTFNIESFLPAAGDHTQIELADATLGANDETLWYVYNLHFRAEMNESFHPEIGHDGMRIQVINDTYFTLSPKPPTALPDSQKVRVQRGTAVDIQYYTKVSDTYWQIALVAPLPGDTTRIWYINTQDTNLISNITLTVTQDTSLKREPRQSSELPSSAKVFARQGSQLQLISHLPAAGNHTQIELAETILTPDREATWYVYNPHVVIEGQRQFLQVVSDTVFKSRPVPSGELTIDQKISIPKNTIFEISSYQQPRNSHVKIALKGAFLGNNNRNTWYCYVPHIYIFGTEIGNQPSDSNSNSSQSINPGDRGIPLQLPGFEGTYYSNDPILRETQYGAMGNFTWGEALHVDPNTGNYRRPASAAVITGIQRIARAMEDIRKRYGDVPIVVTSWYRDPATNNEVGGASQSRHMSGDAVDFVIPGVHPYTVYADLDDWWGNKGGLASSRSFTHIDARGYRARWDYDLRDVGKAPLQSWNAAVAQPTWNTWVKETDVAIYLMRENAWISRILKTPSATNPLEKVLDLDKMEEWFDLPNAPAGMTIALNTDAPEPEQWGDRPPDEHTGEINALGLEVVKHFEGLRLTAYRDAVGIWTIGYGHTSMAGPPTVTEGMTITEAEAEAILAQDLDIFERGVANALTVPTNSDQYSAMVSFAFNVGVGAFRNSTLLRKHNSRDFAGAAEEFLRWVFGNGQVLPGLERRRKAERALYLSEDVYQFMGGSRPVNAPVSFSRAAAVTAGVAAIAGFAFGIYNRFIQPSPPTEPPVVPEEVNPLLEPPTNPDNGLPPVG